MDLICGERVIDLCDVVVDRVELVRQYMPEFLNNSTKFVDIRNLTKEYDNPSVVFCFSDLFKYCDLMSNLRHLKNPFVLVTNLRCDPFTRDVLDHLLTNVNPNIIRVYAKNLTFFDHQKARPVAVGMCHAMTDTDQKRIFLDRLVNSVDVFKKSNDIFFNFTISTAPDRRQTCHDIVSSKGVPCINSIQNSEEYFRMLSTYKFAISPEGYGIDCYRIWECVFLKVIPVCVRSPQTEYYSRLFPIFVLDKWEDFDPHSLPDYDTFIRSATPPPGMGCGGVITKMSELRELITRDMSFSTITTSPKIVPPKITPRS